LANALRDPRDGFFGAVELQENQLDLVTGRLPCTDVIEIPAPGLHGCSFWREGCQSGSDQIRVDEDRTASLIGQKLAGKGGFPRSVRPGNDDDLQVVMHRYTSSA